MSSEEREEEGERQQLRLLCEQLLAQKISLQHDLLSRPHATFKELMQSSTSNTIDPHRRKILRLKATIKAFQGLGIEVANTTDYAFRVKFTVSCNGTDHHDHGIELKQVGENSYELRKYFLPPGISRDSIPTVLATGQGIIDALKLQCFAYYDRRQQIDDLVTFFEANGQDDNIFSSPDKKYVEVAVSFKFLNLSPPKTSVTFILKYKNGEIRPYFIKIDVRKQRGGVPDESMYIEKLKTMSLLSAFKDLAGKE